MTMLPAILGVENRCPANLMEEGEVLVILGRPGAERAAWVKDLLAKAHRSLTRTHYNLTYAVGFLANAPQTPYVVVDWLRPGANALERRWQVNKLASVLSSQFAMRKLSIMLESGAGLEQVAMAEDLMTRQMAARYDRLTLAGGVRLLTADAAGLQQQDPHYAARFGRQLAFRAWVNENPDELTSIVLGDRLAAFAGKHGCRMETLEVEQLKQLGLNLLVAVGQASERSPSRLHIATHNVKPGDKPLMLVGKGITFDTGGINLKPHESFVNCMKNDMGGAGLMINMFMALVESGYAGPLAVVIPCCENLIDGRAMKPGAVIKSLAGKDVIIEHTDAEGRLVLADALTYAERELKPALTIIAATLTTAALRQFTNFYTPVHFANEGLQQSLSDAGKRWGEEFSYWGDFLPFLAGNSTKAADLTNMGRLPSHASMGGGSNVAAHFLREFTTRPMVHLDIFASTWNWSGDYPGAHYGATGAPFNALFQALRWAPRDLWGYAGA